MNLNFTKILFTLLFLIPIFAGNCLAFDQHDAEIKHLIEFIGKTDCTFIRNGKEYDGVQAQNHIAGKYDRVKQRITTAEDFIYKIASRSSFSGRNYLIRCSQKEHDCKGWLLDELKNYRKLNVPSTKK